MGVHRVARLRFRSSRSEAGQLNEIALCCSRRPVLTDWTGDEILGYDEDGIPAR
jgi:hypothetical protein